MITSLRTFLLVALVTLAAYATETPRTAFTSAVSDLAWWQGFADSQLDALLDETFAANPDLKIAAARFGVAEAALTAVESAHAARLAAETALSRARLAEHHTLVALVNTLGGEGSAASVKFATRR